MVNTVPLLFFILLSLVGMEFARAYIFPFIRIDYTYSDFSE